jgi:hypothetical protein
MNLCSRCLAGSLREILKTGLRQWCQMASDARAAACQIIQGKQINLPCGCAERLDGQWLNLQRGCT